MRWWCRGTSSPVLHVWERLQPRALAGRRREKLAAEAAPTRAGRPPARRTTYSIPSRLIARYFSTRAAGRCSQVTSRPITLWWRRASWTAARGRKSVGQGKGVAARVDLGGWRSDKQQSE